MARKLTLTRPIQIGDGEPITELTFREDVVAGDMRGIAIRDPMLWDDILKLAGRLCGQPDPVINRLSILDLQEVAGIVGGFFGSGPMTGPTP